MKVRDDAAERPEYLRAFFHRNDRTIGTFDPVYAGVRIDAHHKQVALSTCKLQQPHVARVE